MLLDGKRNIEMQATNTNKQAKHELKEKAEILPDIPNAATQAALAEYDAMKTHPETYKHYDSFDALMNDAFSD